MSSLKCERGTFVLFVFVESWFVILALVVPNLHKLVQDMLLPKVRTLSRIVRVFCPNIFCTRLDPRMEKKTNKLRIIKKYKSKTIVKSILSYDQENDM